MIKLLSNDPQDEVEACSCGEDECACAEDIKNQMADDKRNDMEDKELNCW